LWQGGPSMAAILGPGGPSMVAKIVVDGPGGPLTAGDQLQRDRSPYHAKNIAKVESVQ